MKTITVRVKPNAHKTQIISQTPEALVMEVSEPAEGNKANIELIKFLSKHFKSKVEIVRGLKSKAKLIRIT